MPGDWQRRADDPLLIHVSELSGRSGHSDDQTGIMALRMARKWMSAWPVAACLAAALLVASAARADVRDHDAVRRAVQSGEIRPLTEILAAIRGKLPGEVVGVEVEQKNGRWLYEFRALDRAGRLFEVYVDARSGEIERIKEK
jgi:uncharacterized membrane protein YkoI